MQPRQPISQVLLDHSQVRDPPPEPAVLADPAAHSEAQLRAGLSQLVQPRLHPLRWALTLGKRLQRELVAHAPLQR